MQIETFKILADLAETASFSAAAERNGMTQSAVSQHIKVLEERFGVTLVERGGRNFAVTPEGDIFLKAGAEILQSYVTIWNELEVLKSCTSGALRVATVLSIGFNDLPPLIEEFRSLYPKVNLDLKYMTSKQVYQSVQEKKVDLGIVAYPEASRRIETCIAWQDQLCVICSPGHEFAGRESIDAAELEGQSFIAFHPGPRTREAIGKALSESEVKVKEVMAFDSIETVKRGVIIEDAISIVPRSHCMKELDAGVLHQVEVSNFELNRPVGILRRKGKLSTRPMDAMVKMLKNLSND